MPNATCKKCGVDPAMIHGSCLCPIPQVTANNVANTGHQPPLSPPEEERPDEIRIAWEGQLIVGNRRDLQAKLRKAAKQSKRVVLDIEQVGYIDSSGIGMLLCEAEKMGEQGGRLVVANPNSDIRTLFELTRFDRMVEIVWDARTIDETGDGYGDHLLDTLRARIAQLEADLAAARSALKDSFEKAYDLACLLNVERPSLGGASPHRFNDTDREIL